jgi:hypothetical protein
MGKPVTSGTLVSIAFLFTAACHSHDRAGRDPLDIPVDEGQRTRAIGAVSSLRDAFNNGSCQSIYEQAAAFFRRQSLQEWMSQCRELKERLGPWQSLSASSAVRCGGGPSEVLVCTGGAAGFAKDNAKVDVAWLLDNGRTQLMWITLTPSNGAGVQIPPMHSPGRFWDPPPPPPLSRSDHPG